MSNHLVYRSFFVNGERWPWKFKFYPEHNQWTAYSGTDFGKKDGVVRGYSYQGDFDGYESLQEAFAYAKRTADNVEIEIMLNKDGGQ